MSAHLLARVGAERFAFALGLVAEVLDAPPVHDLPHRPEGMLGTMRHRGRTLTVWDAASAFGVRREQATGGTVLVFRDGERGAALLVDDAEDIVQIAPEAVREAPSGVDGNGLLAGVVRSRDSLVNVVRVNVLVARLMSGAERSEP
jgi:chemotaxis signal transduction protein